MMSNSIDIAKQISHTTEIAVSFDCTGSMKPAIANVRSHIEKTCEELFQNIPDLKVGFIAHGDYCDGPNCYNILDLTNDKEKIYNFIRNAPDTGGGDEDECYELVLNLAKNLSWTTNNGVLVMIGDAHPHDTNYPQNTDKLDWRQELAALKEKGINVYPLQCLYREHSRNNTFWSTISEVSGTPLMKLNDFQESQEALKGFVYASAGESAFASYEGRLSACNLSDESKSRNDILRGEAKKYTKSPVEEEPKE